VECLLCLIVAPVCPFKIATFSRYGNILMCLVGELFAFCVELKCHGNLKGREEHSWFQLSRVTAT
jgi:hypothetical protein